ncbi:MAG: nucleotidyltransferase domain-containing protein [Alphaproteobacteria bacterium]|nr:nucleotidyltransferase domain-containing protein [Alphaproteobacteria bacterium]
MAQTDPILTRLRTELDRTYGDRIERIVLFGSRARGEARPDSDYDIALFLKDMPEERWRKREHISEVTMPILDDTGAVVNVVMLPAGSYENRTLFMHEIRKDGREL